MKALLVGAILWSAACSNEATQQTDQPAEISQLSAEGAELSEASSSSIGVFTAETDAYDFGNVKEGTIVEQIYTFKNTGDAPLIISQVSASCGCTTPEYSKHPVLPGELGEIKVVFDSNGQVGKQHKIISVLNNGSTNVALLHLRGEVLPK